MYVANLYQRYPGYAGLCSPYEVFETKNEIRVFMTIDLHSSTMLVPSLCLVLVSLTLAANKRPSNPPPITRYKQAALFKSIYLSITTLINLSPDS